MATLRSLLIAAALVLAPTATWVPSAVAQTTPYHLTQTGFRVLYIAPVFIAIDKGFFAAHGVDFTFKEIDSGALGPASLISGSAQIGDIDVGQAADLRANGQQLLMVYNLVKRATPDLIVRPELLARAGVNAQAPLDQRLKALRGATFGITRPGAVTDVYARYFLIRAGLDPERDASLVQIGGIAALETAFRSGRIDAFILSPPLPQKLEKDGTGIIIVHNTQGEVPALDNVSMDAIATTASFAKANGPAVSAYVAAIKDAIAWMRANPDETLRLLAAKWFSDTNPSDLKTALEATLPAISDTGAFSQDAVNRQVKVTQDAGQSISADTAEGVLWTNQYLKP